MPVQPALALYVHVPFCETKCPYCDFNTYAGIESLMPGYVDALAHELTQWGAWLGRPALSSVFFGGGTPSYLPTRDLKLLMRTIHAAFDLRGDAEVTTEANPGDAERERLQAMRSAGFNRISFGVQSFDDHELQLLGRRHSADQAKRAIESARKAGFDNLSLDLMFGLPNQFVSSWEHTLEEAIALGTEHISAYALTLEGGTPMEADVRQGRTPEPDSDLAAEMYLMAQRELATSGLQQYEISNWAKPGLASTHNLTYWRNQPYLGAGPGAHAYLFDNGMPSLAPLGPHGTRYANMKPPRGYIQRARQWQPIGALASEALPQAAAIDTVETVTQTTAMAETMMMGLRLNEGVSDASFKERFGVTIAGAFPGATAECIELGLLEWADGWLRLTEDARLLGNEAFGRFVAGVA
ncbi:MAG: radical SAM family heme chaperone HemW [Dehalococcoidia bacterium]